jgi:hypothetical protein
MSYIVKVHRNGSIITGGSSVGHVYLEFIDTESSELSKQVGFNIRSNSAFNISNIINRLSIYGKVEYDRDQR